MRGELTSFRFVFLLFQQHSSHVPDEEIEQWRRGDVAKGATAPVRARKRKEEMLDNGGSEAHRQEQVEEGWKVIQVLSDEAIELVDARRRDVKELMTEESIKFYSSEEAPNQVSLGGKERVDVT